MLRRGFLSFMGLAGGAVASGAAIALPKDQAKSDDHGIYISLACVNKQCGSKWPLFVNLTRPIVFGNPQCPRCLHVIPFPDDAGQQIKAWHLSKGDDKVDIYTPRPHA